MLHKKKMSGGFKISQALTSGGRSGATGKGISSNVVYNPMNGGPYKKLSKRKKR